PRVDALLGLRGVLDVVDDAAADPERKALEDAAILDSLEGALAALIAARGEEGQRLGEIVTAQIDEIARLAKTVEVSPARTVEAIRTRLAEQVARLMEAGQAFDPARLYQEAVLLATRADVEEELKRLNAHVAAVRGLLAEGGDIGRKLDFLAQELN